MGCDEQRRRLNEEVDAWAAYNYLKDSGSKDQEELTRRYDNACGASTRLRQHISTCPECRPTADQPT